MTIGWVVSNYCKILSLHLSFPYFLYFICDCFFIILTTLLHTIVVYFLRFVKSDYHLPRVITLSWYNYDLNNALMKNVVKENNHHT